MKELIKRSNQAAATFLDRRGYEIIEQPWESDIESRVSIVARDEDTLVFTSVSARRDTDSLPAEHLNREELEGFVIDWLKGNRDYADCPICVSSSKSRHFLLSIFDTFCMKLTQPLYTSIFPSINASSIRRLVPLNSTSLPW